MTKADLVEEVASVTGLTKTDTAMVFEAFLKSISNALIRGNNIEIRGFGRFKVKRRKARVARNPRTGEAVPIPERNVPIFQPSNFLKDRVARGE
jgi:nucleoid DNA-binding protein